MRNRSILIVFVLLAGMFHSYSQIAGTSSTVLKGKDFEVSFPNSKKVLWQYQVAETGKTLDFAGPSFEIDGKKMEIGRAHV